MEQLTEQIKEWQFQGEITDWESWGKVFQDKEMFTPIINNILPNLEVENCTPGTNAVFKVGNYILKIFAPKESGLNTDLDFETELFGMRRAQKLGISVPKLIKWGSVDNKYLFRYLVMEYIVGETFGMARSELSEAERNAIGKKIRQITDKLNTQVEPFNSIDVVEHALTNSRWGGFSNNFYKERIEFLRHYKCENAVFVHGDINPDNVLLGKDNEVYLIDFADGVLAPIIYEHACVAIELFRLDSAFLHGFFGDYESEALVDMCIEGLMLHDFGANIIEDFLGDVIQLKGLSELRDKLINIIKLNMELNR